jgi:DnaJ-class molecular chaperone
MTILDALNLLGLESGCTQEEIKLAYKSACKKYHPDINPGGLEMMKLINAANDTVREYDGGEVKGSSQTNYGEEINNAINAIINLENIFIEICGAWIWVSGNTRTYKNILKQAGFKWAPKKKLWYFRPNNFKSSSRGKMSIDEIRIKYGSDSIKKDKKDKNKIAA